MPTDEPSSPGPPSDHSRTGQLFAAAEAIAEIGHWECALDGRVLLMSEGMSRILQPAGGGTRLSTLADMTRMIPVTDREAFCQVCQDAISGHSRDIEHALVRGDGSLRRVRHRLTALDAASSHARALFGIARDVTEVRSAEAMMDLAQAEYERSNRELSEFAFIASHDLQEPLRKIRTFCDRLRLDLANKVDESALHPLVRIDSAAQRMQTLIQDLLAYSRLQAPEHELPEVDFAQLLQAVLVDLEMAIIDVDAVVEVDLALPPFPAEPSQVQQMMQNLVGNALKFRDPARRCRIQIRGSVTTAGDMPSPECVRIEIEDNGIGFDEKYADRIFEPFRRLHGRSAPYAGSGIGLAIVRRVVQHHGGSVEVRSRPGEGSRFCILLPLGNPTALENAK